MKRVAAILALATLVTGCAVERPAPVQLSADLVTQSSAVRRDARLWRAEIRGTSALQRTSSAGENELPAGTTVETRASSGGQFENDCVRVLLDETSLFGIVSYASTGLRVEVNLGIGRFYLESRCEGGLRFSAGSGAAQTLANLDSAFAAVVEPERTTIHLLEGTIEFLFPETATMRAGQTAVIENGRLTIRPTQASDRQEIDARRATIEAGLRPVTIPASSPATLMASAGGISTTAALALGLAAILVVKKAGHH